MTILIKGLLAAGCAACVAVFAPFSAGNLRGSAPIAGAEVPIKSDMRQQYAQLPMAFERNEGQADAEVEFLARGAGYSLFLTRTEAVFALRPAAAIKYGKTDAHAQTTAEPVAAVVRMSLHGANRAPDLEGRDLHQGRRNYLHGNDVAQWQRDVELFAKVHYSDVYPGIDLVYYGNQQQLEYDFIVAPGRDPHQIALDFAGVEKLRLDDSGNLVLRTGDGDITQQKPVVYQDIAGQRHSVEGRYRLLADNRVGFDLGRYDAREPLVIDPVLAYSSYLGGSGAESAYTMATDQLGNLYVAGVTDSIDFPTNVQLGGGTGQDVFITKFDPHGNALLYSTYLGGSGSEGATGIAVDASGSAYVTGHTNSTDFPVEAAIQTTHAGDWDAFVTKLSPAGNGIVYSTYLGGELGDLAATIALDADGAAYVGGHTESTDFPVHAALQPNHRGGAADGFLSKLSVAGDVLVYSTYLGGSAPDLVRGVDVSSTGVVYLAGVTYSSDFPTVSAFQPSFGGNTDAFVTALDGNGSAMLYSTYLGGKGADWGTDIAVDDIGNAHVVGVTDGQGVSNDFPLVAAAQPLEGGGKDGFIAKIGATGTHLLYSTYLGGSGDDSIKGLELDPNGFPYVVGPTTSLDFPMPRSIGMQETSGGGSDAFVARYHIVGSLLWTTYMGGAGDDYGFAIALYGKGNIYVGGLTNSTDMTTLDPMQARLGGGDDAFVARLGVRGATTHTHDFDGDAVADVVWRNVRTGTNAIWSAANYSTPQYIRGVTDNAWKMVGVGDFTGDLRHDILWRHGGTGANVIWKSANYTTQQPVAKVSDQAWEVAGIGDFDHDGKSDILWRHARTGANVIWKSANAATARALTGVTDLAWKVVGIGDFNGDGSSDILWRHHRTGANVIWNSGEFRDQWRVATVSDLAWEIVGVGDFYGDGKSDILWRNSSTGANRIWMSGDHMTPQQVTGVTNLAWRVAAIGDYNGDGRSDILWRHSGYGTNAVWRSGSWARQQPIARVGDLSWTITP